jgi:hypothetical protein
MKLTYPKVMNVANVADLAPQPPLTATNPVHVEEMTGTVTTDVAYSRHLPISTDTCPDRTLAQATRASTLLLTLLNFPTKSVSLTLENGGE